MTSSLHAQAFSDFVTDPSFPCLAGRGVVHQSQHELQVYAVLGRRTPDLGADLARFARSITDDQPLRVFVAVFPDDPPTTEDAFEKALWAQLQQLHDAEDASASWDSSVSSDPQDPDFSFSFAGRAFFVIGLHPHSSRMARRFAWPALVFNPHAQLDRLRAGGRFDRLRTHIRARDIALQGSINPNVADFGTSSEARQYSGRATEADWRCPFHHPVK